MAVLVPNSKDGFCLTGGFLGCFFLPRELLIMWEMSQIVSPE